MIDAKSESNKLVERIFGNRPSATLNSLKELISEELNNAYRQGMKDQLEITKALGAALSEPSVARQVLPETVPLASNGSSEDE